MNHGKNFLPVAALGAMVVIVLFLNGDRSRGFAVLLPLVACSLMIFLIWRRDRGHGPDG